MRSLIRHYEMRQLLGFTFGDWKPISSRRLINRVLRQVRPGMIILLHDGYSHRSRFVAALPKIIQGIKNKGLGFS